MIMGWVRNVRIPRHPPGLPVRIEVSRSKDRNRGEDRDKRHCDQEDIPSKELIRTRIRPPPMT